MNIPVSANRRQFLQGATALGLIVGFHIPDGGRALAAEPGSEFVPNAFIRIAPDNSVTILLKHSEMGQGVWTSLPMVVAEELGCDWSTVRVEHAPAAPEYAHTAFGLQMTGGSTSTWESFDQLRTAGAMARTLLIAAAAAKLGVNAVECRAEKGHVVHGKRRIRYGEVADAAAKLPMPADVKLSPCAPSTMSWRTMRQPVVAPVASNKKNFCANSYLLPRT